jgi:hypothetical protein
VSRNSGTRRIREDTQGHVQGANQVRGDTVGPAGILKDTSLRRFGTVRPRVQIPGPRPKSEYEIAAPQLPRNQLAPSMLTKCSRIPTDRIESVRLLCDRFEEFLKSRLEILCKPLG